MESLISQAIRERRLVRFTHDGRIKTVEPHVLGRALGKQKEALLCWQVSPPMQQAGFWRLVYLGDLSSLEVLETRIADLPEGPPPPVDDFSVIHTMLQQ